MRKIKKKCKNFLWKCSLETVTSTVAQLAQLDKHRSAEQVVAGSNHGWTNTQGLKITEENVLPL